MPEPNTGCILWTGHLCARGYGRIGYASKGSAVLVHRIAYECANGPIPRGMVVCHTCDTPMCVNPDHLFVGTQKDNMRDMFKKGRGNPRGAKPKRLALLRAVASPELALVNTHAGVKEASIVHHIRTVGTVPGWRRVIGVPPVPQHHDGPSCKWPDDKPLDPTYGEDDGYRAVATPAPCCGGAG